MKLNNIGEITDKMLELERKYDLLGLTINDIKIYQVMRYVIYIAAINSNVAKHENHGKLRAGLLKKIVNKSSRIKNYFVYNPFSNKEKDEILLFESSRKLNINGSFIDPFTFEVKKKLEDNNTKFFIYQTSYFFDRLSQKSKNTKHLDYIYLNSNIKSRFVKIELKENELLQIKELEKLFINELNISLNLLSLIKKQMFHFIVQSEYYGKLLDIKKPKQIFIVNFCDKTPLINECKKRNIEVVDIQHGFISSNDIMYHYPDTEEDKLEYFPDKFISWTDLWMGGCKLPLSEENIKVSDNYAVNTAAKKYENITKKKNKVMVLSQDTLTLPILNEIYDFVLNNPAHEFFYKPHPSEYAYIASIEKYLELKKLKNFFTVGVTEDLHKHFAESQNVIGVYSTTLIEALYFNCNVYILDLPGSEMMNYLVRLGKIKKIDTLKFS